MKMLRYPKDTEARCTYCNRLVFVFSCDVFDGEFKSVNQIYQNKGQAPWHIGEKLICRNCENPLNESLLKFISPEVKSV